MMMDVSVAPGRASPWFCTAAATIDSGRLGLVVGVGLASDAGKGRLGRLDGISIGFKAPMHSSVDRHQYFISDQETHLSNLENAIFMYIFSTKAWFEYSTHLNTILRKSEITTKFLLKETGIIGKCLTAFRRNTSTFWNSLHVSVT